MLKRLFSEGFRVFFLGAGLFAILAVSWWEIYLGVHYTGGMVTAVPFAMAPHEWHGHELVFGYGSAALGGFLLTAVPNWTGAAGARHWFIGLAAAVWLAGRVALWASGSLPPGLVAAVDLAFLPILWVKIAGLLVRRPKPQNLVFLVFISLFWLANLATHLGWAGIWDGGEVAGPRAGILALAGMILVIGGRVAPALQTVWVRPHMLKPRAAGVVSPGFASSCVSGLPEETPDTGIRNRDPPTFAYCRRSPSDRRRPPWPGSPGISA